MDEDRIKMMNESVIDVCKSVEDSDTIMKLKEFVIQQSIINRNLIDMVDVLNKKIKILEDIIMEDIVQKDIDDIKVGGND
ncbi:hypothetical protein M0R19_08535 [Candidatus Pacearchaeota archaeon]|jgi:hypothetical protein|nr:hypothetical protein [bacterium]MCK9597204.1 hypothetical protein [Candidatus Pacearchaeota archaeon]